VIRILLAHRGALLRGALAALLSGEDDLELVAELDRGEEVVDAALRVQPDVAVLDYMLPGTVDICEVCKRLCRAVPDCRVLTVIDRRSCVAASRHLLRLAPRVGLVSLDATPAALVDSVRRLARGEPVLDPDLAMATLQSRLQSREVELTDRECEVLRLARLGATAKEIATSLCLSTGTVRNYLSKILTKLEARTRIEAINKAQEAGWI
jgi:two-component system, NarL family, response regulator DesR